MVALYNRELYGEPIAEKIQATGRIAVNIANRWALGWSGHVTALLRTGEYMPKLIEQYERELDVLAATVMPHLSESEILAMHDVPAYPPAASE